MQQDEKHTEMRCVLEAIGGSAEAFSRLADRYGRLILGLAYSYVGQMEAAQDISQEAFLKAWLSLSTLHRPERFGSWLRQITANLARDHLRRQGRRKLLPLEEWDQPQEEDGTMEQRLLREEILKRLDAVPEGPRTALVLHYLMGMEPAEAARHLGISRAAFDTRLSRGREGLRREMTQLMDEALTQSQTEAQRYLDGLSARVRAALTEGQRERATAARELALLAARSNQERLALDLQSHNEATRQAAAQLMAETGDPRAIPALIQGLKVEEEPAVQAEYCRSLARLRATEAAPLLQGLARQTAEMAVHKAAIEAARLLDGPAEPAEAADIPVGVADLRAAGIEELLLALLDDESPRVRAHGADGLGRVESVRALAPLVRLLATDPQEYVRLAAAEALGAIAGRSRQSTGRLAPKQKAQAVEALLAALCDPFHGVAAEAARSLSLIDIGEGTGLRARVVEGTFAALDHLLQQRPGAWWSSLPLLLGQIAGEAEMDRLARVRLQNPQPVHNGPLNHGLERMAAPGRTAANPLLMEVLHTRPAKPDCLLLALGKSQDQAAIPVLLEHLGPSTPHAWKAAAQGLAHYPDGAALLRQAVEAWLAEPTPEDGPLQAAIAALEDVAAPTDAAWLAAAADRMPPRSRITARAAARRIGRIPE